MLVSGIRHGSDTSRYLSGVQNLLAGAPFVEKQASYVGYIAIFAMFESLRLEERGVIFFNSLATHCQSHVSIT